MNRHWNFNLELVSNIFQISGSLKSKPKFSQKHLLRKSCLTTLTKKVLLKNLIQRALLFNYAITSSQVQTGISINYCFCFCLYSFGRKNKPLYDAKVSLVALKGRDRAYLSYYSLDPLKSQLGRRNSISQLDH